ncbi:MAG: cob(I)yrinic acid a,c-diamide adenosyltransferase [Candidatus Nealsonbacteria bacterium]|nr:MAG: cob(I)yrinic acid a,c-diamide adenosyltransferase [Candidatus Nealsonbacteria bacterium]
MIYVFTGNGKGKTSAAIGMAVRAVGAGEKVLMVQFLKDGKSSEIKAIKKIKNFDIRQEKDLNFLEKTAKRKYNLVILDEVNVAMKFGLLGVKEVSDILKQYRKKPDLVLTGRWCPKEIIKMADLVTELKEIKHYYKKGVKAKRGREY